MSQHLRITNSPSQQYNTGRTNKTDLQCYHVQESLFSIIALNKSLVMFGCILKRGQEIQRIIKCVVEEKVVKGSACLMAGYGVV